jgi:hypothetical protein
MNQRVSNWLYLKGIFVFLLFKGQNIFSIELTGYTLDLN